ncbi:unnamed protein product [Paramecium primaurelia]|uniref:Uncharacterized protein n=1 Tax=Paramecium primaurelia TaxID=5886 RepID=A0A8S1NTQ7_PARPR|nr:unnamed protein product [Paramecium primaurelia]
MYENNFATNSIYLLTFNIINFLLLQFEIGQIQDYQKCRSKKNRSRNIKRAMLDEKRHRKIEREKKQERRNGLGGLKSKLAVAVAVPWMDKLSFDIKRYQNSYKIKGVYLQFPLLETLEQKTQRADQVSKFIIYNKNSLINKNQIPNIFRGKVKPNKKLTNSNNYHNQINNNNNKISKKTTTQTKIQKKYQTLNQIMF